MDFGTILKNFDKKKFIGEFYNKRPHCFRECDVDTAELITICEKLYSNINCNLNIDIDDQNKIFMERKIRPELQANYFNRNMIELVPEILNKTFVLSRCEKFDAKVRQISVSLKNWLGTIDDVSAQFFYSSPKHGFGYHTDMSHAVVIQLAGKKTWELGSCKDKSTTFTSDMEKGLAYAVKYVDGQLMVDEGYNPIDINKICLNRETITLNAGDILYLPPFYFHHTKATNEPSLALNLRFTQPNQTRMLTTMINARILASLNAKLDEEMPLINACDNYMQVVEAKKEFLLSEYKKIVENIQISKDELYEFLIGSAINSSSKSVNESYFAKHFKKEESKHSINNLAIINPELEYQYYTNSSENLVFHYLDQILEFDSKAGIALLHKLIESEKIIDLKVTKKLINKSDSKKIDQQLSEYIHHLFDTGFLLSADKIENNKRDRKAS